MYAAVRIAALACALACVGSLWGPAGPALAASCSTPLQQLIDAAPAGSVLKVPACVYQQAVRITKRMTLDGQGQAEIRGSDPWSSWTRSAATWVSTLKLPTFNNGAGVICLNPRCNWPEQTFFDGTPLVQVASGTTPGHGQFSVNSARQVVLADNPSGHVVEVSTRTRWIDTQADNITIQGFTMRHAANPAQTGAIGNQGRNGWTLQNNRLYDSHGAIVVVGGASNPNTQTRVLNNVIADSGFLGILGNSNTNTLIQGNQVFWNNTEGFHLDWAGGGIKLVGTTNAKLDTNVVHHNSGPGLWCDQGSANITVSQNRVWANAGHRNTGPDGSPQIFFEISSGASIWGNAVWGTTGGWPGIYISSSGNAEVKYNVVAWADRGLQAYLQQRCCIPAGGETNVYFHDNVVIMGGNGLGMMWGDFGSNAITAPSNHAWNNAFWYPTAENGQARYQWGGVQYTTLAPFVATRGGAGSRYLSLAEMNQTSAVWGIPTQANALR